MYGKKVWGIERTTFVIGPDQTLLHIFPKVTPAGPRRRGAGADQGMEEGAQVKRTAVRRPPFEQRRPKLGRCCPAPSLRRRRSGWLRGCWARCWRTVALPGCWPGRIVEVEAYLGPHNRPARPGRPRLSRPHAAELRSLWPRGACVCLCDLWPLLLHEHLLRGRGPGRMRAAARAGAVVAGRHRANGAESWPCARRACPAADLRPQPALPGAGAHAAAPQRPGSARPGLAAAGARRRLCGQRSAGDAAHRHPTTAVDWPLRFALPGHECVSGPKSRPNSGPRKMTKFQ